MGAGGIGGYVGGRLAEAGHDVSLIARGSHLAALQSTGLRIESPYGDVHLPTIFATSEPSDIGVVDAVLFTVKLADTDTAAKALVPIVGEHTRIVTLQNGIDSKNIIGQHITPAKVASGIIYLAAYIKQPGVITNPGGLYKLNIERLGNDATMAKFFAACDQAKVIDATPSDDGEHTIWHKFIALVGFSGVTALARLPIGAVYENPETLNFMRQLLKENIAIARAKGLDFDDDHVDYTAKLFANQPYEQKSSLLVDIEAGKPTELEWLSGRVHQLGIELGIATPCNSAVWAALAPYKDGPPL
jgi:2-dehydropantoate 2-reductase